MPAILLTPVPNTEAAQFLRDKPAVSREVFDRLLPDLQARAITITGIEELNVVQAVRDRIAELPEGADWFKVREEVAEKISPWVGDKSARRAELLLRSHGYQSYAVAQERTMEQQRGAFPFAQYVTAQDDRVRDSHAALDGVVLPSDSPFWERHTPPWEWGCRCSKVYLTAESAADIARADERRKPEARRVLTPEQRTRLENSGMIERAEGNGVPRSVNVTPRDGGYAWNPRTLTMDAAALSQRYDAATWRTFETWARNTLIDGPSAIGSATAGRTVLEWLNRTSARVIPLAGAIAPAPEPARATADTPAVAPRKAPVSAALNVRTVGAHKPQIFAGIAAVDRVHDDGALPRIPIYGRASRNALGIYRYNATRGTPIEIGIRQSAQGWPAMTTVHEIGHFLDHQVLGRSGVFATNTDAALRPFLDAVQSTAAARQIAALGHRQQGDFLKPTELWARAYAQYVAVRSSDPTLLAQLDKIRTGVQPWRQWSDADFAPVAAAIDQLFKSKGWIK
jgi:SPP1 gp7 family putative phage head morphogenesis protein